MDSLNSTRAGEQVFLLYGSSLSAVVLVTILIMAYVVGSDGCSQALALLAVSSLLNLLAVPEIRLLRQRKITVSASAILLLQLGLGLLASARAWALLSLWAREVWRPGGLLFSQMVDQALRTAIGCSSAGNLLPIIFWIIGFNAVFLSMVTGLSYFTTVPSTAMVALGLMWRGPASVGLMGYLLILLLLLSIGFESLIWRSAPRRKRLLSERGKAILTIALLSVLIVPLSPDLRKLSPLDQVAFQPSGAGAGQRCLRFSTTFTFPGSLRFDSDPVMIVRSRHPLFMKALTYDTYTGREFLQERGGLRRVNQGEELPTTLNASPDMLESISQNITLLTRFPGILPAAYQPTRVMYRGEVWVSPSKVLHTSRPIPANSSYRCISTLLRPDPSVLRDLEPPPSPDSRYLQLPDSLPGRVRDLAEKITSGAGSYFDRVLSIATYLKSFGYDLGIPQTPPGRDVVDYFLFDLKRGYCQHFAAAMTVLCRSVGIPARVVTGFGSGSFDKSIGAYRIFQYNSHAWVEVEFDRLGWVAFDPTPGGVGGPEVADAADAYSILGGTLPYPGTPSRRVTSIQVTHLPPYASPDEPFLVEGVVLAGSRGTDPAAGVDVNVTLNTSSLSFPPMVKPVETMPILLRQTKTLSDGSFMALCNLPPEAAGLSTAELTVICEGDELFKGSATSVSMPIRFRPRVSISFTDPSKTSVLIRVTGPSGPVADAQLDLVLDSATVGSYRTNSSGFVRTAINAGVGSHLLVARFRGKGRLGPSTGAIKFRIETPTQPPSKPKRIIWIAVFLALLLAAGTIYLWKIRSKRQALAGTYYSMLEIFRRAGFPRSSSQTPREYLHWLEARGLMHLDEAWRITLIFEEHFYGQGVMDTEKMKLAQQSLTRLRQELRTPRVPTDRLVRMGRALIRSLLPRISSW